jgi:hypothetical protein
MPLADHIYPLRLDVAPSRLAAIASMIAHLLALLAVFASDAPDWLVGSSCAGLVSSAIYCHLRNRRRWQLLWQADQRWRIGDDSGELAGLRPDSFVSRWIVVLHLCSQAGKHYRITIWPDQLGANNHRLLRARLKLDAAKAAFTCSPE